LIWKILKILRIQTFEQSASALKNAGCAEERREKQKCSVHSMCSVAEKSYKLYILTGMAATGSTPHSPVAAARIAEHPRAVCCSVWLEWARCFSLAVGERRDGGRLEQLTGAV
jgi:hypothetical protein